MNTILNSKRLYAVTTVEAGEHVKQNISIEILLTEDKEAYEFIYALQELTDEVLDLKIGESLYFKANRDNDLSKGIISRIK